ncbi:DUF2752 domain-containing protein [Actinoallomurus spadix]|uniref:DUF2752 domain-containing protein n=1 Tax=Actinoallomurus spadix TaxID=79912 RepID=A0ABN0WTF4_9ACTN|nr:DUF2752 domain-containing protein [Actinoallomurus spadix]MCO5986372.1 DUF2752 domain-containing protein [Actinoallomurus spadix]
MAIGRPWGVPARAALLVAVVAGLAALRVPRPPTLCVLRQYTGVPCPLCGFTTAAVHLGHADLLGAVHASPLAVAVCAGFLVAPLARRSRMGALWRRSSRRTRQVVPIVVIVAPLIASEIWQLARFGII